MLWLYMGMMFLLFCWYYEDYCFYLINYLYRYVSCWRRVGGRGRDVLVLWFLVV